MQNRNGFTLIELLVVIAIIGILAALTIPQFAAYRAKGYDARTEQACRDAATAEEAFYVDRGFYTDDRTALPGFEKPPYVNVEIASDTTSYDIICNAPDGTPGFYCVWHRNPDPGTPNIICGVNMSRSSASL